MIPFLSGAVGMVGALAIIFAVIELAWNPYKHRDEWLSVLALLALAVACAAAFKLGLV